MTNEKHFIFIIQPQFVEQLFHMIIQIRKNVPQKNSNADRFDFVFGKTFLSFKFIL